MSRNFRLFVLPFLLCLAATACAHTHAKVQAPEPAHAAAAAAKKAPAEKVRAAGAQAQNAQAAQPAAGNAQTAQQSSVPPSKDKALVREYERFSLFAHEQVSRMNASIIGGRRQMRIHRGSDGLYHATYKAIDVPGVICQVNRSKANPRYYVGNLIYTEELLESTGKSARACRHGEFSPVSKEGHRIIYISKRGGGWQ